MPTPSFKKRRSSNIGDKMEAAGVITLVASPFLLVMTAIAFYVYGVISAFKVSAVIGVVALFPPVGIVEGIAKLFRYDVALALKAIAAANGVML